MNKTDDNTPLSEIEIKKHAISEKWKIISLDTTDSTNTYAKSILSELKGNSAIITARQQTAGRGRLGRSFFSPRDTGIYMSLVIKPTVSPATIITTAAAVAVCQVCEECADSIPQIKWVNDIFLNGKKICGILTEGIFDSSGNLSTAIVGIGVNLSTTSFPDDLKNIAGSLMPQNITKEQIIGNIAYKLDMLLQQGKSTIMSEYKKRLMVLGKTVSYDIGKVTKKGVAIDINEDGNLIVETDTGIDVLSSGEISLHKDFI